MWIEGMAQKMMKTARETDLQWWHDLPCRLMPSKQDRIESQYFSLLILAMILISNIFQQYEWNTLQDATDEKQALYL